MSTHALDPDRIKVPATVLAFAAVGGAVLYYLLKGQLELIAYLVMLVAALLALLLPARWSVAVVVFFAAISGFVKLLADYSPLSHLDNDVVFISFLAGYVARRASVRQGLPRDFPLRRTLLILAGASLLLSAAPMTTLVQALGGWKSYVLPALVILPAATELREEGSLRPLVWALILAGVLNASVTLLELAQGRAAVAAWGPGFARTQSANAFDALGRYTWRPPGITSDGGAGAPIDAEAIALCILVASSRVHIATRAILIGAVGLCALSLFQEGERSGVVEAGVGGLVAVLLGRGNRRLPALGVGLVAGWLVFNVLGSVFSTSHVHESRITSLLDPQTYLGARGQLFVYIGQTFVEHPLGIGMGQTIPAADFLSKLAGADRFHAASENTMLGMLLELGWAGGLVVVLLFGSACVAAGRHLRGRRPAPDLDACTVILAALLSAGLSGNVLDVSFTAVQVWLVAAILVQRTSPGPSPGPSPAPAGAP